ncbi:hypothetical protein [Streptomyces sp. NPDC004629]|uniref:hypothetical protein n=1 Tax=Streptomyces sp. NPDC004629 TaxID=3364705 RepID=UPI0036BC9ACA
MATAHRGRQSTQYAAAGAWAFLGLVLLCISVLIGVQAAVTLGVLGESGHIAASDCVRKDGGKGGPYTLCEGRFVSDGEDTTVPLAKVRYPGRAGDDIPVRRAPWGTFAALDDSLQEKAKQSVIIGLLLSAALGCMARGAFYLRKLT